MTWLPVVRGLLLIVGVLCSSYAITTEGPQTLESLIGGAALMLSVTLQQFENRR